MKIDATPLIFVALFGVTASCDEPPTKLRMLIDASVDWYEVFRSEDSTESMKPVMALRWPNTIRGSTDGATVFWLADGRPEAVVAMFSFGGNFVHEFDSLSRGTIVAKRDSETVWNPRTPGLTFRPIEGAPKPARFAPARLRQMKVLAKDFTAKFLGWKSDNSQVEELRRMTTPLHRYKIDKPDTVLDGVIFAYASGTDPEVLLIIEAFGEPDAYQWHYAFVRRSSAGLEGLFRDEIVWAAKKNPPRWLRDRNHTAFKQPLQQALEALEGEAAETEESDEKGLDQ
jgi:hypothetical protein